MRTKKRKSGAGERRAAKSCGALSAFLLTVLLLAAAGAVQGQVETDMRFNFSTPGARSLAMGGAFIGLADDATAAYTNPAGLTNLALGGPEAAIEMRGWRYSPRFAERGNPSEGSPTGLGIDTVDGLGTTETVNRTSGLSFLSAAYVFRRGATVALYRHELANYQSDKLTQGLFNVSAEEVSSDPFWWVDCRNRNDLSPPVFNVCRTPPLRDSVNVNVVNYGVSGAMEIGLPWLRKRGESLSVGLGVSFYQLDVTARTDYFYFLPPRSLQLSPNRQPREFFGPADLLDDNIVFTKTIDDQDTNVGWNAGFLWKLGKSRRWSVGGVYRQGPEFKYAGELSFGRAALLVDPAVTLGESFSVPAAFHIPDVYGIGLAYSHGKEARSKLTLDYQKVRYSQRFADLIPDPGDRKGFQLSDADEVHLGLEHVFLAIGAKLVGTLRLGAWYEPAHEVEAVTDDPDAREFFPRGSDEVHWSGGLGFVVREAFQIDAAADFSEAVSTVSLSLVKFF